MKSLRDSRPVLWFLFLFNLAVAVAAGNHVRVHTNHGAADRRGNGRRRARCRARAGMAWSAWRLSAGRLVLRHGQEVAYHPLEQRGQLVQVLG
jgi:hypothetical protein